MSQKILHEFEVNQTFLQVSDFSLHPTVNLPTFLASPSLLTFSQIETEDTNLHRPTPRNPTSLNPHIP